MAIASNLPLGGLLAVGFLLLTITFVATTGDSMAYAVAQACVRDDSPPSWLRAMWAVIMGGAAAVLISIGDGGITALQSFIVITAVPVGFVLLPSVFAAPIYVRRLALEQRRYPSIGIAPAGHPTGNTSDNTTKETTEKSSAKETSS